MIVLDASAALRALVGDATQSAAVLTTMAADTVWYAPGVFHFEVLERLRAIALKHGSAERRTLADAAAHQLSRWLIRSVDSAALVQRAWDLRHNIDASDALYVAAAEHLGCALVTADARLAKADGTRCQFVIV